MSRERFATSKNGIEVTFDPETGHAITHFEDTPGLREAAIEIVGKTVLSEEGHYFDTDMGRVIGNSDLVETDDTDEIVYALRKNRDRYGVFTKSRKPVPTSIVTVVINKLGEDEYDLYSAWAGPIVPPFPGDEKETPESRPFWANHALAWGNQEVQEDSVTSKCPW